MKKSDIRHGQPYAYDGPTVTTYYPTYVVSANAIVHKVKRPEAEAPRFDTSRGATRPRAGTWAVAASGYPIVTIAEDTPELRAKAAAITLFEFLGATEAPEGLEFGVLISLPKLLGPFDEWHAEQKAAEEVARKADEDLARRNTETRDHVEALVARAQALGVEGRAWARYESGRYKVDVSPDHYERLVELAERGAKQVRLPVRHLSYGGASQPLCKQVLEIGDVLTSDVSDADCTGCIEEHGKAVEEPTESVTKYRVIVALHGQRVPATVSAHRGNSRYVKVDEVLGTAWARKTIEQRCFWIAADAVTPLTD